MRTNLSKSNQLIIKELVKKGGTLSKLSNTDIYMVKTNKKTLYFLDNYSPIVPYIYSIFFTGKDYLGDILRENKIKLSKFSDRDKRILYLFVTNKGYYNMVQRTKYADIDVSKKLRRKDLVKAYRILRIFPRLGYINLQVSFSKNNQMFINKLTLFNEPNILHHLYKGKTKKIGYKVIADSLI